MVGQFEVEPDKLKKVSIELEKYSKLIYSDCEKLQCISNQLSIKNMDVKLSLNKLVDKLREEEKSCTKLANVLQNSALLYANTDKSIAEQKTTVKNLDDNESEKDEDSVWDYVLEAIKQITLGSWSPDDYNLLGTSLSLILGLIPIVGMIMDIRDFCGDIKNLCTDGATAGEWLNLILDGIAVALDFVDAGDIAKAAKIASKNGDDIVKVLKESLLKIDYSELAKVLKGEEESVVKVVKELAQDANTFIVRPVNSFIQNKWEEIKETFTGFTTTEQTVFAY